LNTAFDLRTEIRTSEDKATSDTAWLNKKSISNRAPVTETSGTGKTATVSENTGAAGTPTERRR